MSGLSDFQESISGLKWSGWAWEDKIYSLPGAFQKVPVHIRLRGIPIIIDQNGKFFTFNNKATVVDINKSHRFHIANIYLLDE